jgi:hypothetical protein
MNNPEMSKFELGISYFFDRWLFRQLETNNASFCPHSQPQSKHRFAFVAPPTKCRETTASRRVERRAGQPPDQADGTWCSRT